MKIKEARKLRIGDMVKQKSHGYVMKVIGTFDSRSIYATNKFVSVDCRTEDGSLMRCNHKELEVLNQDL